MNRVWVYEGGGKKKLFETAEAAQAWFDKHDPEGVAFEYEVQPENTAASAINDLRADLQGLTTHPQPSASADAMECADNLQAEVVPATYWSAEELERVAKHIQQYGDARVVEERENSITMVQKVLAEAAIKEVNRNSTLTARNAELTEALGASMFEMEYLIKHKSMNMTKLHELVLMARKALACQGDGNGGRDDA